MNQTTTGTKACVYPQFKVNQTPFYSTRKRKRQKRRQQRHKFKWYLDPGVP